MKLIKSRENWEGETKYPGLLSEAGGQSAFLWSRRFSVQHQSWWNPKRAYNENIWLVESHGGVHPKRANTGVRRKVYYLVFSRMHCSQVPGASVLFCCTISSKPGMEHKPWLLRDLALQTEEAKSKLALPRPQLKSQLATLFTELHPSLISGVQPVWAHRLLEETQGNVLYWLFSGTIHHTCCLSIKGCDNGS